MLCKMLFSEKNKKNVINLSSAELAQIMVMVKELLWKQKKDCIEIGEWQFSLRPDCAVHKCIELYTRVVFTGQQISGPRWLSWIRHPTGDQEVAGSTPAEVGNILLWRLIMKYFLRSFSPFR